MTLRRSGRDIMYTRLEDSAFSGLLIAGPTNGTGPRIGTLGSGDVWSGLFRVQRNFWP